MTTTHIGRAQGHPTRETGIFDHPDHTLVKVRGDLDIATAPALRERLVAALRPRTGPLILDLSGVSFCDAAGLAVLIGTQRRAGAHGIVMLVAAPGRQLRAMLSVTGLDRSLSIHPTVADAHAWALTHNDVTSVRPDPPGGGGEAVPAVPGDRPSARWRSGVRSGAGVPAGSGS
jgi:anti-anti-sigma factor